MSLSAGNDVWSQLSSNSGSAGDNRVEGTSDVHLLFVGSKGSGKSSLLNRFRTQNSAYSGREDVKPTVALEYSHRPGKREANNSKQTAHIWELGGGTMLEQLVGHVITPENVENFIAVVVADLSEPWGALDTVLFWIERIRSLAASARASATRQSRLKSQSSTAKLDGSRNITDKELIDGIGIPVVIVGAKFDIFVKRDPDDAKLMAKALRFIAHLHQASLIYTSLHMQPLTQAFVVLMNHYAFKTSPSRTPVTDPLKPQYVLAGSDSFSQIVGSVPNESSASAWRAEHLKMWREAFMESFAHGDQDKVQPRTLNVTDPRHKERLVDELRASKDKHLAMYRTECEVRYAQDQRNQDLSAQAKSATTRTRGSTLRTTAS